MIVPGDMRELRSASHVTRRIDTVSGSAVRIIDNDKASLIEFDARPVAAEIVGVRSPANRYQKMCACQTVPARQTCVQHVAAPHDAAHALIETQANAFAAEDVLDGD
jgi:hypothetical protein